MENKNNVFGNINNADNVDIGDKTYNITNVFDGLSLLTSDYEKQLSGIEKFLFSFKLRSAYELIVDLEKRVEDTLIEDKNKLKSKLLYLKAICKAELNEFSLSDAAIDFVKAFKLNPNDEILKERACVEYVNLKDIPQAIKLADEIIEVSGYNKTAWFIKVFTSKDILESLSQVPRVVIESYDFQHSISYQLVGMKEFNFYKNVNKLGFDLKVIFEKYKNVTLGNKSAWVAAIDLTFNDYLNKYPSTYIFGSIESNFSIPEVASLLELLKNYIIALEKTEISDTIGHQKFIFYYLRYFQSFDINDLEKLLSLYNSEKKSNWSYCLFVCQALNHNERFDDTISILEEYINEGGVKNTEYLIMKTVITELKFGGNSVEGMLYEYLDLVDVIDELDVINILHTFFNLQTRINDNSIYERELRFILEKKFKYVELKVLFEILVNVGYIEKFQRSEVIIKLNEIKNCNHFSVELKELIAKSYEKIGLRREAIYYLEKFVDKATLNSTLRLYITLLYNQLLDKEDEERGRYKELLALLKNWRTDSAMKDEFLLIIEHNLHLEIDDLENLEQVDRILFDEFP